MPLCRPLAVRLALLLAVGLALLPAPVTGAEDLRLERAQAHLDAGEAQLALQLAEEVLAAARGAIEAEALLVRSTAYIMLGDVASGYRDLRRAVKVDPELRQAWLNLAGLEIAERDYDAAEKALREARELDPAAADSYLNLGAVALLRGDAEAARQEFVRHLELTDDRAEASFLIAANYAMLGLEGPAVSHLTTAVEADERYRLRARQDDRFSGLSGPTYRQLLTTDLWTPPADRPTAAAAFQMPYRRQDPRLLYALLEALRSEGIAYEAGVEATDEWALVWADGMRLKLSNQANGTGVVRATGRGDLGDDEFEARSQQLFRALHGQLAMADAGSRRRPGS